ncbi:XdhC family protein [Paenibacillus algorifonticola]|uniref:XdhC family protein n=1 Tax=Paenibacillus algorifonticola TaxID=684063 RepID=UPI003D285069
MHEVLDSIVKLEQPAALATIIRVEGHAYRKEGAAMLLRLDRTKTGSISPGCLEADLQERVSRVCSAEAFEIIIYNMQPEEDIMWGDTIGCGGIIHVLLEPVTTALRNQLLHARERLRAGESVVLDRSWSKAGNGIGIVYRLGPASAARESRNSWQADAALEGEAGTFFTKLEPRPRTIVFGAGPDAEALCTMLPGCGFDVVVADWRTQISPENEDNSWFSVARVIGKPDELASKLQFNRNDFFIICSHQLHYDYQMIQLALEARPIYIGVMGSRKRIKQLFGEGVLPKNVYAPIGLSIEAESPYEIALSIASELIQVRAAHRSKSREATGDEGVRHLFGGWPQQPDETAEAAAPFIAGSYAWQPGASCSIK